MKAGPAIENRLPQRPETERELLGALLLDETGDAFREIISLLSASDFYLPVHRKIFSAMQKLVANGKRIDAILLADLLAEDTDLRDAGGIGFISSLSSLIHKKAAVGEWAKILRSVAIKRNVIYRSDELQRAAFDPQVTVAEIVNLADGLSSSLNTSALGDALGTLASEITPEHVTWIWPGRIPLGKITVLDGDPGLGKSAVTLDLAARITTGKPMPDGATGKAGGVLVLNAEDGSADTIVPRLVAMGATLDRVRILKTVHAAEGERQPEIPLDLPAIERAAESVKARLIIVDPLMAFLSSETNSFRDQDIRRALAPVALMAERLRAAVLIVRHLNKNAEGNPIYRGGGSIGIIGAARCGLLVARDPDDHENKKRILAVTKTNLGPGCPSLCYTIEPAAAESIRVCWAGESLHQASSLLASTIGREERTDMEEAQEFLTAVLEDGPLAAKDVLRKGHIQGYYEKTLKRAKDKIGIRSKRQGFGAGSTWVWELPSKGAKSNAKEVNSSDLTSFAQDTDSTSIESGTSPKKAKSPDMAFFEANTRPPSQPSENLEDRVRVVSWELRTPPIEIAGVGQITDTKTFADRTLERLQSLIENPKQRVAWTVSQLVQQLAQVGVVVEVLE